MDSLETFVSINKLKKKYPYLLNNEHYQLMSLPHGWLSIIDKLCSNIMTELWKNWEASIHITHIGVFGGILDISAINTIHLNKYISLAVTESSRICYICGEPGIFISQYKNVRCVRCKDHA